VLRQRPQVLRSASHLSLLAYHRGVRSWLYDSLQLTPSLDEEVQSQASLLAPGVEVPVVQPQSVERDNGFAKATLREETVMFGDSVEAALLIAFVLASMPNLDYRD
jgi:hypothetical protein